MKQFLLYFSLILLFFVRYFLIKPAFKEGQNIRITAKVLQQPLRLGSYQKLSIKGLKIYLPKYPLINYGDFVVIEGEVKDGKLINPLLINIKESKNSLFLLRKKIVDFYKNNLPEPHSSLVAGITLGYKSEIPEDLKNILQKTGTIHVIVASGMNVTFVAGFLLSMFLLFISRKKTIPFVLIGIWCYAILSGFEAPIVRSSLMATVAFLAQETGRLNSSFNALALSALIMLVVKPEWINDLGFILSFTATASLMIFSKRVEKLINWVPKLIRGDLSTTIAAQVGVSPILFVTFGQFNILSPLINLLVLWTIPIIMIIGSIGGLIGLIVPFLGRIILYLSYPLTYYFVNILKLFN